MHWKDLLVDDKVLKVTMSKSKYDHIGTFLRSKFLQDITGFNIMDLDHVIARL